MACGSCNRVAPRTRRLMRQPLRPFPPSTGAHRGAEGGAGWGGGRAHPLDSSPSTHSVTRGDHSKVIAIVIPMPPPPPPPPMSIPIAEVPRPSNCCNICGRRPG